MKNTKKIIAAALSAALSISEIFTVPMLNVSAEPDAPINSVFYTGDEATLPLSVTDNGIQLQDGVDYDVTYENNTNAGTATAILTFKGNYSGERRVDFNIVAKPLADSDVTVSVIDNQIYTGSAIEAKPSIQVGDITLVEGTDYNLSYANNIEIGTATIDISFSGNYSGSTSTTFEIIPNKFTSEDIENGLLSVSGVETHTYTGSEITPLPTIKYGNITFTKDKDYTLSYENNINVGTATITVTFKGSYTGSASVDFDIIPKTVSIGDANENNISITAIPDQIYTGKEIRPQVVIVDIAR